MIVEGKEAFREIAKRVDFLETRLEVEMYVKALMSAKEWSDKVDKDNKEYFSKNHLIDKYNV